MAIESYTRITANRIFDSLQMSLDFNTIDKIFNRSNGFCHSIIKQLAIFTKLRNQADKINQILGLNQDIIVELIFKLQSAKATEEQQGESQQERDLNSLREYSEKVITALEEVMEKITIYETKYMRLGKETLDQWRKKQHQNAEIITDAVIATGLKCDESFTDRLSRLIFLEICNEKTFNPENQIMFSVQQILKNQNPNIDAKVKQVVLDMSKIKKQLMQPFEHITENITNEQAILTELFQRVRALSSATRDYIIQEENGKEDLMRLANDLQDIASDKATTS